MGVHPQQQGALHVERADQYPNAVGCPATPAWNVFFYSSSACVYNAEKQKDENVIALKEEDAYPALPEGRIWLEKTF